MEFYRLVFKTERKTIKENQIDVFKEAVDTLEKEFGHWNNIHWDAIKEKDSRKYDTRFYNKIYYILNR